MADALGWTVLLTVLIYAGLFIAVVLFIAWALRFMRSTSQSAAGRGFTWTATPSARETLDQRYARGEISREEYLQARRDLGEQG